jgi:hypothetical protein
VQQKEPDRPNTEEIIELKFSEMVAREEFKIRKIESVVDQQKKEKEALKNH